jgi:carotenoid cleavage dioxygenase-like enzyme
MIRAANFDSSTQHCDRMGSLQSHERPVLPNLAQHELYSSHCHVEPVPFSFTLCVHLGGDKAGNGKWFNNSLVPDSHLQDHDWSEADFDKVSFHHNVNNVTSENAMEPVTHNHHANLKPVEDSLFLSAAAYCGDHVDHILDGYSCALVTRIASGANGCTLVTVVLRTVSADAGLAQRESKSQREEEFGMFTKGHIPWYKYLFGARLVELATTGSVIERSTAHQPIFFPPLNHGLFCSANRYHSFRVDWDPSTPGECYLHELSAHENWLPSGFRRWDYACMHPLYDASKQKLLTYTFKHSTLTRKTTLRLFEFDGDTTNVPIEREYPTPVEHIMHDRVALHMFGFTENYFVVFANSLRLESCGNCFLICGKPIMRAMNDDFCGDLIIHFIPRDGRRGKKFIVNTKRQGYVYHAINCFELDDGTIVVDAFVSYLNAARESAQFELDSDRHVFDNDGDSFRFHIHPPHENAANTVSRDCIISSLIDSTIDFHCINPRNLGQFHSFSYMVSHTRHRNSSGNVEFVESILHKICVKPTSSDPLDFDPLQTVVSTLSSNHWQGQPGLSCYLRTPVFVQCAGVPFEDGGRLLCWSYDSPPDQLGSLLHAYLLIFNASSMQILMRVPMPDGCVVPYSVHSAIYSRNFNTQDLHSIDVPESPVRQRRVRNKKTRSTKRK